MNRVLISLEGCGKGGKLGLPRAQFYVERWFGARACCHARLRARNYARDTPRLRGDLRGIGSVMLDATHSKRARSGTAGGFHLREREEINHG